MRRDAQGRLLLSDAIAALGEGIDAGLPERVDAADLVQASKDLFLFALGTVLDKHGDTLMEKQDLLGRLTDLAIGSFAMESVWARAEKARRKDSGSAGGGGGGKGTIVQANCIRNDRKTWSDRGSGDCRGGCRRQFGPIAGPAV